MPLTKSSEGQAFKRVVTDYAVRGIARTSWYLRYDFRDPLPHRFQLEVNRHGNDPDSWENVGTEATNVNFAVDDQQRLHGKSMRIGYRVRLETPEATYISEPSQVLGKLSKRQWLLSRATIRRLLLDPHQLDSFAGYLMKRKIHGTPCPDCVDIYTGGIRNSDCETCNGTGKLEGYWKAAENQMFDFNPQTEHTHKDDQLQRGTVNDVTATAKMIGIPQVHEKDVWIDANSDRRYYVSRVNNLAEMNQVPLVVAVQLRLAPMTDVIYNVDPDGGS